MTGGNLAYEASGSGNYKGLNRVFTFDPWTERWTEQPGMGHGRWYPTQTLLPDGRTLITSGRDENSTGINAEIELFNPPATRGGQGSVTKVGDYGSSALPGSPAKPEYYPHWIVMPNGYVLNAGPHREESWALRFAGSARSTAARPNWARPHYYGTGVLLPGPPESSTRVAQIGGFGFTAEAAGLALPITELFDEAHPDSRVKVGELKRTLPSGRSTLNVKLKSKARKAIKKAGSVKLRVAVVITDAAGNRASRQATVKLKR